MLGLFAEDDGDQCACAAANVEPPGVKASDPPKLGHRLLSPPGVLRRTKLGEKRRQKGRVCDVFLYVLRILSRLPSCWQPEQIAAEVFE